MSFILFYFILFKKERRGLATCVTLDIYERTISRLVVVVVEWGNRVASSLAFLNAAEPWGWMWWKVLSSGWSLGSCSIFVFLLPPLFLNSFATLWMPNAQFVNETSIGLDKLREAKWTLVLISLFAMALRLWLSFVFLFLDFPMDNQVSFVWLFGFFLSLSPTSKEVNA